MLEGIWPSTRCFSADECLREMKLSASGDTYAAERDLCFKRDCAIQTDGAFTYDPKHKLSSYFRCKDGGLDE